MTDSPPAELVGREGWTPLELPPAVAFRSFVSGDPLGERLRVRYFTGSEAGVLHARAWFGAGAQGPPGHAHGGSLAAVLDESMGGAAWMNGHAVVAVDLNTRFRRMLPLGTTAVVTARVVAVDGRKVRTVGTIADEDGGTFAEGRGLFLVLGAERLGEFARVAGQYLRRAERGPPGSGGR